MNKHFGTYCKSPNVHKEIGNLWAWKKLIPKMKKKVKKDKQYTRLHDALIPTFSMKFSGFSGLLSILFEYTRLYFFYNFLFTIIHLLNFTIIKSRLIFKSSVALVFTFGVMLQYHLFFAIRQKYIFKRRRLPFYHQLIYTILVDCDQFSINTSALYNNTLQKSLFYKTKLKLCRLLWNLYTSNLPFS